MRTPQIKSPPAHDVGVTKKRVTDGQHVYPGAHLLRGRHLTVEVMDPNAPNRYNTGVRFTPVAGVIRVVADGREFLRHQPKHDPQTDVAGLFAEFDLVTSPPGFDEAMVGEPFVKVGVGALVKTEGAYGFWKQYKVWKRAETKVTWSAASAHFVQEMAPIKGYGYSLGSHISLREQSLTIEWTLKNTGTKPFETQQYAHNCIAFDNAIVKPGTTVAFPFDVKAQGLTANEKQVGQEIRFERELSGPVNITVDYPPGYTGDNAVSVISQAAGLRVDCLTSIPGSRVALHADTIYVCPEQFVVIRLNPGQSRTWTRHYRFRAIR